MLHGFLVANQLDRPLDARDLSINSRSFMLLELFLLEPFLFREEHPPKVFLRHSEILLVLIDKRLIGMLVIDEQLVSFSVQYLHDGALEHGTDDGPIVEYYFYSFVRVSGEGAEVLHFLLVYDLVGLALSCHCVGVLDISQQGRLLEYFSFHIIWLL